MKNYLCIVVILLATLFSACESQEKHQVQSFHISISRNPTFAPPTQFHISPDSILISYTDFDTRQPMNYVQHWTPLEKQQIAEMISKWDLSSFDAVKIGDHGTDGTSYSFDVKVDSLTFQKYTYFEKIKGLFELTNYMDERLPDQYTIGYNDSYFNR